MPTQPIPFVDLRFQSAIIEGEFLSEVSTLLASGEFVGGSAVSRFEEAWAAYLGCASAVAVGNGGDAIEIGLRAIGVGIGDEVIIPANTFAATAQAVIMAGATPVAADIQPGSNLFDPDAVRANASSRTRAVIAVNLYGERFNDPGLVHWCRQNGVYYCEDSAQSHGAIIEGNRVSPEAAFTAFSFYPGKNLGALGDAGAVVFNSDEHDQSARRLRNYGSTQKYVHECAGRNSRLDSVQALALLIKLRHLDRWNQMRIQAADTYLERLAGCSPTELMLPSRKDDQGHVWHLFVVEVENREKLARRLTENEIGWGIHYPTTVNSIPGVGGHYPKHADERCQKILSLPLFPGITTSQIDRVCDVIRESLAT